MLESVVYSCLCLVDVKRPHQRAVRDDVTTGVGGRVQLPSVQVRGAVHPDYGPERLIWQSDVQSRQHHVVSVQQGRHDVEFGEEPERWQSTAERQHRSVRLLQIVR